MHRLNGVNCYVGLAVLFTRHNEIRTYLVVLVSYRSRDVHLAVVTQQAGHIVDKGSSVSHRRVDRLT